MRSRVRAGDELYVWRRAAGCSRVHHRRLVSARASRPATVRCAPQEFDETLLVIRERVERLASQAIDLPVLQRFGAEGFVEVDGGLVPVEDGPFQSTAVA